MTPDIPVAGFAAALGVGLLIGVVRERAHPTPPYTVAGLRTHVLLAVGGAISLTLGMAVLVALLVVVGALAVASYFKDSEKDVGLTGEVTLTVTPMLGALALRQPGLAGALSVIIAAALLAKRPLHKLVRERVNEQELTDALLLAGAALVVLPLLPTAPIDPWGALVPSRLWRIVVLILAVGMAGHVMLRLVGARWGLPMAGFLAGFASSTAAVAGFGHSAKAEPKHVRSAAAGALFANLGSLVLLAGVVATAAPHLLTGIWPALAAAAVTLAVAAGLLVLRSSPVESLPSEEHPRAFRLSHALLLALLLALILLVSAWMHRRFGNAGVLVAAAIAALAEVHAAAASIAQLAQSGEIAARAAGWGIVLILFSSALSKSVLAFVSGGAGYGLRVSAGLAAMPAAAAAGMAFSRLAP